MTEIFKCVTDWCPHGCEISIGTDIWDPPHYCPYDPNTTVTWKSKRQQAAAHKAWETMRSVEVEL